MEVDIQAGRAHYRIGVAGYEEQSTRNLAGSDCPSLQRTHGVDSASH